MFLSVIEPLLQGKSSILDLCAAPGGKSTHLISMRYKGGSRGGGGSRGRFVSNEVIRSRYNVLKENIVKWGDPSVEVISRDPSAFAKEGRERNCFDFILVDAPCSGEGMFRKEDRAIEEWSPENVALCAARQRRILSDIWPLLLPGGVLVYSTCTFNIYENEQNVEWLVEKYGAEVLSLDEFVRPEWGVKRGGAGGYRLFPGLVRGEGLFVAVLRKAGDVSRSGVGADKRSRARDERGGESKSRSNTDNRNRADVENKSRSTGLSRSHERNSREILVEKAFAIDYLSEYPSVELTKEQALRYLSKETIVLKDAPLGYIRVTYGGLGLGFVKNLGSRANNLYPKNWRIKMEV